MPSDSATGLPRHGANDHLDHHVDGGDGIGPWRGSVVCAAGTSGELPLGRMGGGTEGGCDRVGVSSRLDGNDLVAEVDVDGCIGVEAFHGLRDGIQAADAAYPGHMELG